MPESETVRTALRFVNEINRHDVDSVLALVSDDHLHVDALGRELRGRERLREAWAECFREFPDYHLGVKEWFQNGRVVGLFGIASGTRATEPGDGPERRWQVPAAWRIVVRDQQIVHWQEYVDGEAARRGRPPPPSA
jgi:ketosteroid isomerase-like protein